MMRSSGVIVSKTEVIKNLSEKKYRNIAKEKYNINTKYIFFI